MNRTLFDGGVRQSVELKNGCLLDITSTMEKTAELSKSSDVKCNCCGKTFKGQQYIEGHMKFKHPTAQNDTQEGSKTEVCWLIQTRQMFVAHCLKKVHKKLI